jgi:hypothetical protein
MRMNSEPKPKGLILAKINLNGRDLGVAGMISE